MNGLERPQPGGPVWLLLQDVCKPMPLLPLVLVLALVLVLLLVLLLFLLLVLLVQEMCSHAHGIIPLHYNARTANNSLKTMSLAGTFQLPCVCMVIAYVWAGPWHRVAMQQREPMSSNA